MGEAERGNIPLDDRGLPTRYPFREEWEVTPRQVRAKLAAGDDVVLIDCRTPQEHAVARIEGAELVPLQEVGSRLSELEEYADREVVTFCHHGGRSLRLAAVLRQHGFENVKSMAGGIDLWSQDVDSSVPRY